MNFTFKSFPFLPQLDSSDCGFACLRMISKYYGVDLSIDNKVFTESSLTKQGLSFKEISNISEKLGFDNLFVKLSFDEILDNVKLPSIFFWDKEHFVVVYKITNTKIYIADPGAGKIICDKNEFLNHWREDDNKGIVLVLQPTDRFYNQKVKEKHKSKRTLAKTIKNLSTFKKELLILSALILLSSIIEIILPFFTQNIIDKGVKYKNVNFLHLILVGQLILFISKITNEFYRNWLFINISARVSLKLVSDFLLKVMNLPIKFFNSKNVGDLLERIDDHKRIESFLTDDLIKSVFSFFSLSVFTSILYYFNNTVFLIFLLGNIIQQIIIFSFFEKIKFFDKKKFVLLSREKNKNIELITGIQEIKINNLEKRKKSEWEDIQNKIFENNIESLKLNQKYESYRFVSFLTYTLITYTSALSVIDGEMSLGTMMSISFIIGASNAPITQLINSFLNYQLLMVSIARLEEIEYFDEKENISEKITDFETGDINVQNLSFSYNKKNTILKNINFSIKKGTTTAIVGLSGSGKTTLIKLLLKFYDPVDGNISMNNIDINNIDDREWRNKCGVIFQDSFIFSNTIAFNIALEDNYDKERLKLAVKYANIESFIESLPLKNQTIIGQEGTGISHGQKQRILIARIIYKNPEYVFFDEATNSLDAENEKSIVENIHKYFKKSTMIIVAHRLNTVINADKIIVLNNGEIIEEGNHESLISLKGSYYKLIKNQLELGK